MLTVIFGLVSMCSVGAALYSMLNKHELVAQVGALETQVRQQEERSSVAIRTLKGELSRLEALRKIPDIVERGKRLEAEIAGKLEQARMQAGTLLAEATAEADTRRNEAAAERDQSRSRAAAVIRAAEQDAELRKAAMTQEAAKEHQIAKTARIVAEDQARQVVAEAQSEAKRITAAARKEAKEKTQKVDETLDLATAYAFDIRRKAEARAEEIGGQAYEALKLHQQYAATAQALKNRIDGYGDTYLIPADHVLDELAYDYGFHKSGERLKLARERVKIMERNGMAATCQYPDGWKKDYAVAFVLDAFNGKVDAILARIKPANHGKLILEIRDTFALTNRNGEVFRSARILDEFLVARLEELDWGVAVQKLKEKDRDEQRAIKERIKEEEKAKKEYERAIKQAEREEALLAKALEKARQEFDNASSKDREQYEAKFDELAGKLREAEEKNRRAISMAQQTKCGHVYVISNVGSFGEDVYKIGLTRRLEPLDRVRELGDASVPFSFDVHAMIYAEDAPALEAALHRRFLESQVNKVNRRKEFFRVKLQEVRDALAAMNIDARWTLAAEARDYRDTLALEERLQGDAGFRRHWTESEAAFEVAGLDEEEEAPQEDAESMSSAKPAAPKRPRVKRQSKAAAAAVGGEISTQPTV